MTRLRVTTLAKQRRATGQHTRVVGAVRRVTQAAVLADWHMLPKERATFLCVALVAGVVERLADKLQRGRVPVRAVTTAATHLAFEERMGKRLQRLIALQLMTAVANLGLRRCPQNGVARLVADMTVGAGDLVIAMRPTMPSKSNIGFMAVQAHVILQADTGFCIGSKFDDGRPLLPAPHSGRVCSAWSVAGLALQPAVTERAAWIRRYRMFGPEYG